MLNARFYTVQYCLNCNGCLHIILGSGYKCLHLLYVWRIKCTFWYQIHIMRYQIYGHLVQSCFQDFYIPVLHYSSFFWLRLIRLRLGLRGLYSVLYLFRSYTASLFTPGMLYYTRLSSQAGEALYMPLRTHVCSLRFRISFCIRCAPSYRLRKRPSPAGKDIHTLVLQVGSLNEAFHTFPPARCRVAACRHNAHTLPQCEGRAIHCASCRPDCSEPFG